MSQNLRKLVFAAIIGAVYAALTMVLAPISYGPIQFRISEALCILPFFFPFSAWGLFVGCLLANLISAYGPADVIFGSLATLLAALGTMLLGLAGRDRRSMQILACLPPVISNGIIVGAVLAWSLTPDALLSGFLTFGGQVAFGELVVLYLLGLPLLLLLHRSGLARRLMARYHLETA